MGVRFADGRVLRHWAVAARAWGLMACVAVAEAWAISPAQFLPRLEKQWSNVLDFQAGFDQTQELEGEHRTLAFAGTIRSVTPAYVRLDFRAVPQAGGDVVETTEEETIVFDGRYWYHYYPAQQLLTRGEEPDSDVLLPLLIVSGALALNREQFKEYYTIKPIERTTLDGVSCYRMELMTRTKDRSLRATSALWLRETDLQPLLMESKSPLSRVRVRLNAPQVNSGLRRDDLRLQLPAGQVRVLPR